MVRPSSVLARWSSAALIGLGACSNPLEIEVRLVDPCDQEAVATVDFIRVEPRGEGIDGASLGTVEERGSFTTPPIDLPLAPDFQLVATGHRGSFDAPPSAFGLSAPVDLTAATGPVQIQVPLSLLGRFHRTTVLGAAEPRCSSMVEDRFGATATVLPNGKVLIVGGARYIEEGGSQFLEFPRSVEVYDPSTGEFLDSAPGESRKWSLGRGQPRRHHTATLLPDGRVLVAGGQSQGMAGEEALRTAFLIDARDGANVRILEGGIAMVEARTGHQAVALADGRVVLVGGRSLNPSDPDNLEAQAYSNSIEIFDPQDLGFSVATDENGNQVTLSAARYGHQAVALPGRAEVFVAGGFNGQGPVPSVEVIRLEPGRATRVVATDRLEAGVIFGAAAVTEDGSVVLSGGYSTLQPLMARQPDDSEDGVEMWAVESGTARRLCRSNLGGRRGFHTASVIGRRAVFVGGLDETGAPRADAEAGQLLSVSLAETSGSCFADPPTLVVRSEPEGAMPRAEHMAVVLPTTRELLVLGGTDGPLRSIATAEVYSDFARTSALDPAR